MAKSILELMIGSFDEKRVWRQFMKRVNALPKDYRYAYKKILHYFYNFGCDNSMLIDLLELFELNAAEGKPVLDLIGNDVAAFCDALLEANHIETIHKKDQLNREIMEYFHRDGDSV